MKAILIVTLYTLLVQCNGDISERIPTPIQSLVPPTFENPIKDYTVGLVPPPIDGQPARDDTRPKVQQRKVQSRSHVHSNPNARTSSFVQTPRQSVNSVQQRPGYSVVHQKTHHSSNLLQPQVYQPKTTIYQPFQQSTTHHHQPYTQYSYPATYSAGIVRQPVAAVTHNHQHKHFVSTPQYYSPVTQNRVHQHSTHTQYVSIPVQRGLSTGLQHIYPSVQKSAFVPRTVSSYGGSGSIVQTYPSVSYTAIPKHGSTLDFGNAKLDPELVQVISQVYGQYH
ncbi:uncharacterized protein LOC129940953 [Eupeodes corollae]|uniref:uncharacterized protein LOC129940953 n=1 Tax=Eupeodes corollae TaxID=290404 RepID=UPI0024937E39|nr:uncharacterized protein LOC129940953 [Eupeodes corollae]